MAQLLQQLVSQIKLDDNQTRLAAEPAVLRAFRPIAYGGNHIDHNKEEKQPLMG
jgi:hypothetical protein